MEQSMQSSMTGREDWGAAFYLENLENAGGAMSRGDWLSALRFARRAAGVPKGMEVIRCDAYMLLALTSLELELAEDALAFAIGASLSATRSGDEPRQGRAAAIVDLVVARYPWLGEHSPISAFD